jgi:glycine cleavage system regulatory protein
LRENFLPKIRACYTSHLKNYGEIMTSRSLTIDEAVAQIINWTFIPEGFSLLDMTSAFLEEADVEYYNALIDNTVSEMETYQFMLRLNISKARHEMAHSLFQRIEMERENPDTSLVFVSGSNTELTLDSVIAWALDEYDIDIFQSPAEPKQEKAKWENVKIKIYENYKLGLFVNGKLTKKSSFQDIDLIGSRKNDSNKLGGILIGLSQSKKFPGIARPEAKDKTALSKLRKSLKKLTGISDDPFFPFNESDGWRPRFKLIDDRLNADERAKKEAKHLSDKYLPESSDFENENDDAGKWLQENG